MIAFTDQDTKCLDLTRYLHYINCLGLNAVET